MRTHPRLPALAAAVGALLMPLHAAQAQLLITGNDEKVSFDENTGRIDGKIVRKVDQADVGGLAEGIAFSPDGRYLYVGNFVDGDIDVLRADGDNLTKVASLILPGRPASMRGSTP
jgi:DNA-binding beta-propeller fold protein YncE